MAAVEALQPAIVLLGAGTCAALASRAVRLSPIVGYLLAGLAIGPYGLGFIEENDTTHLLAELGVVFLLFDIGLHFSLKEIKESRRDILGLAPLQMLLCSFAFTIAARLIGCDWPIAIAVGISVGLSSTAVVTRLLADKQLGSCPLGRSSTAVLIFQDIIAIFLLIFASSLDGDSATLATTFGLAILKSVIAFAAAVVAGRYVVRPLFRTLATADIREVFTMVAILIVVSASAATGATGLSLTLGGFLAGLAISDSPYRHVIQTEVEPFRGLLVSFFFINVGMMINVPALFDSLFVVIAVALAILVIKSALVFAAAKLNDWTTPGATQLASLLAQGSEFTLVVLAMPAIAAGMPEGSVGILVAATALSLGVAPAWSDLGMRGARWLANRRTEAQRKIETDTGATAQHHDVIVFGMTDAGRLAIDALRSFDIPYIALDADIDRFVRAMADGYDVNFGDAADFRLIESIGATSAKAIVIGAPRFAVAQAVSPAAQERFPHMRRFVAVDNGADKLRHEALGMKAYITASEPVGIELAADLLRKLDIPEDEIEEWVRSEAERFGQIPEDVDDTEPQAA